jgi:hypothetical protein
MLAFKVYGLTEAISRSRAIFNRTIFLITLWMSWKLYKVQTTKDNDQQGVVRMQKNYYRTYVPLFCQRGLFSGCNGLTFPYLAKKRLKCHHLRKIKDPMSASASKMKEFMRITDSVSAARYFLLITLLFNVQLRN